ncbi:uncharacterized protein LOC116336891 [Contarinia nasturtii]|uniref:uncharacterized protein LOC116336891 n=1 Tax=Contarinia nasturtii TaxID=265458 RepID=UPI0012D398BB|nr:uncharacterized protein LOC116336891 [Contarinia nasturtii]
MTFVLGIIDGAKGIIEDAKEGEVPYIALVKVLHPHTGVFEPLCAGAIISETEILTNAVCAAACKATYKCEVYVGRVNVNHGGKKVEIKDTVWHESYVEMNAILPDTRFANLVLDIGILYMSRIPLSETVKIIALPQENLERKSDMRIAGWGSGFLYGIAHHEKLKVAVSRAYETYVINKEILVIKTMEFYPRPCVSDMGAPIVYMNNTVLAGVGSLWTFKLCKRDDTTRAFYTDIYNNTEWIANNRNKIV